MHSLARVIIHDFTHSRKPLILVLYKIYHPQKCLSSLIFNAIVSIGEGFIHLNDRTTFFDKLTVTESVFSSGFAIYNIRE